MGEKDMLAEARADEEAVRRADDMVAGVERPTPLPCPFCGGNNIDFPPRDEGAEIVCMDCCASLYRGAREIALAAWNRRAPWTVTREELRAAMAAGDKAVDDGLPGVALMKGGIAMVEALGGKVEG